jgi:hypothetical protein
MASVYRIPLNRMRNGQYTTWNYQAAEPLGRGNMSAIGGINIKVSVLKD